jgi:hypothetical protein
LLVVYVDDVNLRPDGAIRGKQRTLGWEGWGERCGKSRPLRLLPPFVLDKDRWVGSHEKVLNVLITS